MTYRPPGLDSLVGKTPDGFVVLEEIGRGATAAVYRAMEPAADNRLVALKVMHETEQRLWVGDAPDEHPFERELRFSKVVRDPSVVRIFKTGRLPDGRFYVAMELVAGMTLAEELAHRGTFPLQEALEVIAKASGAVASLHARRIVHRDLSPGNLMVRASKDGALRLKLIDFGVAKLRHERDDRASGVETWRIGTPRYMAPEAAKGEGTSPASDVYGLGAMLYELLAGQPPIALKRPTTEGYLAYLRADERPLPSVPLARAMGASPVAGVVELVEAALSRAQSERPADAGELRDAVTALQDELGRGGGPPDGSARTRLGRALRGVFGRRPRR